jgi:hypothetical protein
MDRVAGYPRFFIRNPGNGKANGNGNGAGTGNGKKLELWTVGADNGFQILRFEDQFQNSNQDLLKDALGDE